MMSFLKLIRFQNLLLIALMQVIFRYGFLDLQNIKLALNDWQYALLVISTISIAAAGYIINNIFDQETDDINKPQNVVIGNSISEKNAYNLYVIFNVIGVGIGFYLSNLIAKPGFAIVFVSVSGLLYLYASSLKQSLLIGNIIIALLCAFSIVIIGIFDLYPIINLENNAFLGILFQVILDYALFCFIISFIRELVKDLEDFEGDSQTEMSTLPIVMGISKTVKLTFVLSLIPIIILLLYTNNYYISNQLFFAAAFVLLLVAAPLFYFSIRIYSAKTKTEFHHLSNVLKLVLFFGIISILIITLNVKYNA